MGHKSWHVWKKDNIERVQRDERLDRERMEALHADQQKRDQEFRMEQLTGASGSGQHVELFPPPTQIATNKEHEEEKKQYELRRQRREGTAPWELGGGSRRRPKPWYLHDKGQAPDLNRFGKERSPAVTNKHDRGEDPMASMIKRVEKKKTKKKKRKKSDKKISEAKLGKRKMVDIEALRQARLEREKHEQKRQKMLK